jgi:Domain of unknown function (DUF5664)
MSTVYRHKDGSWKSYPETQTLNIEPGTNYAFNLNDGQSDFVKNIITAEKLVNSGEIHTTEEYLNTIKNGAPNEDLTKGIRYNKGKPRWRNFPMFLMEPLIKVGSANEKHEGNPKGKYPTHNFLNGLKVSDTLDSLHRHLCDFSNPSKPDIDPEDNVHHLAKVAWNALVALYYIENKPEWDDRTLKHDE